MAKTIKYIGKQDRWAELPVTGSQAMWRIGQQESRSDAEAALLLATGLFSSVLNASVNSGRMASGASGAAVGVRDGDGKLTSAKFEMRNSFLARPIGGAILSAAAGSAGTFLIGMASPVPFFAYRVIYTHLGGNGALSGFKMLAAASDDVGSRDYTDVTAASFTKTVTPKRAGVTYNSIVTDASPGWKALTWTGGTATANAADLGSGKFANVFGDIVFETGVLDSANGFYPLLLRYTNGSGAVSYVNNLTGQQTGTNAKTDFPSQFFMSLSRGGDAVTTPSGWGDGNTPSVASSAPNITVEFFTTYGVISVSTVGDSRFHVSAETAATTQYRSTENYLHSALKALGAAPSIVRHGIGGAPTSQYQSYALPDYGIETPAGWLAYIMFSRNPGATNLETDANIAACKGYALQIVEQARKKGQRVLIIPAFPTGLSGSSSYTAPQLANLKTLLPFANSIADVTIDALSIYGDSQGAWLPGVGYDSAHMKDSYLQDLASRMASAIYNFENGL